jgi:hypothetical protein
LALEVVFALLPAAVVIDLGTALRVVKIIIRRSTEVLLSMCVVAFTPLVLLIDARTERSLVAVKHELL